MPALWTNEDTIAQSTARAPSRGLARIIHVSRHEKATDFQKSLLIRSIEASVEHLPPARRDPGPGREAGLAGSSVAANLLYTPAKLVMALFGLPADALTFVCTGGNMRAAYVIWVPTVTGTYFLTPAPLEGVEPIEFVGSRYPASVASAIDWETRPTEVSDTSGEDFDCTGVCP
jgi:hypothetical protein